MIFTHVCQQLHNARAYITEIASKSVQTVRFFTNFRLLMPNILDRNSGFLSTVLDRFGKNISRRFINISFCGHIPDLPHALNTPLDVIRIMDVLCFFDPFYDLRWVKRMIRIIQISLISVFQQSDAGERLLKC